MQNTHLLATLIVSSSGAIQQALHTVLALNPHIHIIGMADDYQAAQEMLDHHHPEFVVIDSDFSPSPEMDFIRRLKSEQPATKIIVLVNSLQQQQELLEAGADAALLRDVPAEQIMETINHLSQRPAADAGEPDQVNSR